MAKLPLARGPKLSAEASTASRNTVGNTPTTTTPENEQAGTLTDPNMVLALLLYGTDSRSLLPKTVNAITIGSDPKHSNIVLASKFVSGRHLRLERKGTSMRATDLKSKNGTFVEGELERVFHLKPGKSFMVGARAHHFLSLNEAMLESYPQLQDILGAENEHVLGGARENPSPSDLIVAAVAGAPLLIVSEPHCDQERLARVVHRISRNREREIVELTPADIPHDRKARDELIKRQAARSTFVLALSKNDKPLDPTFAAMLFKSRYQVRVVVLAGGVDVADNVLGRQHAGKLQEIWLRPIASRPEAIDRLFDRMLEERASPLRMSYLTPENQEAVQNYSWPDNFQSLRLAATRLTAIYRSGSIHQAALALRVGSSSMYSWYSHTLKLKEPLSRRLISRDERQ